MAFLLLHNYTDFIDIEAGKINCVVTKDRKRLVFG